MSKQLRSVNMAAAVTGGRSLSVPNDMQSVNDILRSLEEGSTMTAFFKTKKPESSVFCVKLETRELIGARIRGLSIDLHDARLLMLASV